MRIFNTVVLFSVLTGQLFAELSIENIENMVKDIRAKRTSKIKTVTKIDSPFIVVKKDDNLSVAVKVSKQTIKTDFSLGAVINDSAFIDGEWRRKGDIVGEFKVILIGRDHVVLKRKKRTITLYFEKAKEIIKTGKEQK